MIASPRQQRLENAVIELILQHGLVNVIQTLVLVAPEAHRRLAHEQVIREGR
jgi:hypothetical protein